MTAYSWNTTQTDCVTCHGDVAANMTTQAHGAHMNASVQFAQNIVCGSCHAAGTAATHINGSVNSFGGSVSFAYTGGVAITETTFGSCGANACHNRGYYSGGAYAAPLVNPYSWNTTQTNCVTCRGNAAGNMNTTPSHTAHLTTPIGKTPGLHRMPQHERGGGDAPERIGELWRHGDHARRDVHR